MATFIDIVCLDGSLKIPTDQAEKLFGKYKQANNTYYIPSLKQSLALTLYYARGEKISYDKCDQIYQADLRKYTDWIENPQLQEKQEKNKAKDINKKAKKIVKMLSKFNTHWYSRSATCKKLKGMKNDFMAQIKQLSDKTNIQLYDLMTMTKDELLQINKDHNGILEQIETIYKTFFPAK